MAKNIKISGDIVEKMTRELAGMCTDAAEFRQRLIASIDRNKEMADDNETAQPCELLDIFDAVCDRMRALAETVATRFQWNRTEFRGSWDNRFDDGSIILGRLSREFFLHFERCSFSAGRDECPHDRKTTRKQYSKTAADLLDRDGPVDITWAADLWRRIAPLFDDGDAITQHPVFKEAQRVVFGFHAYCFALYPRPELIIRRDGSPATKLCVDMKAAGPSGKINKIAFMILPGVQLYDVVIPAIVAFETPTGFA